MMTFKQAAALQASITSYEAEAFFEDTLCAAFVPRGGEAAYFALSTAGEGSFIERMRSINQWFINATARAPHLLLVHPSVKERIDGEVWERLRPGTPSPQTGLPTFLAHDL